MKLYFSKVSDTEYTASTSPTPIPREPDAVAADVAELAEGGAFWRAEYDRHRVALMQSGAEPSDAAVRQRIDAAVAAEKAERVARRAQLRNGHAADLVDQGAASPPRRRWLLQITAGGAPLATLFASTVEQARELAQQVVNRDLGMTV